MKIGVRELWIYAVGLFAGAQLGKMPPLMPLVALDLGLTLVVAAIVISLIEGAGALFGAGAAAIGARIHYRRTLVGGVVLLSLGGFGEAVAQNGTMLIAFRALESLGYLGVVVAAPVLMTREATRLAPGPALILWSTFLPVGLAVGAIASGALADLAGWRITLALWAVLGLALLTLSPRAPPVAADTAPPALKPSRVALLAALGFGCYALFQVGMYALLPQHLIAEKGASIRLAGLIAGLGGLATVGGVVVPSILARRLGPHPPVPVLVWAVALFVPPLLLLPVFADGTPLALAATLFIALNVVSGAVAALVFASLPRFAGHGDMGAASGALAQAGATGSLCGPPVFALFVEASGWLAAAAFGLAISAAGFALLAAAERQARRTVAH